MWIECLPLSLRGNFSAMSQVVIYAVASHFMLMNIGWVTVIGWQASVASGGYLSGTLIQGMIALSYPDYQSQRWHRTLLFWVVILLCVFVNTTISSMLPKLEGLILIIYVLGFFAILIPLVYMASHGLASDVLSLWLNHGGWST